MCGISVVVSLKRNQVNGNGKVNGGSSQDTQDELKSKLTKSLDIIAHRGPDAQDIWINPENTIGLAHCRLSINDLSTDGIQPLHDDEGHIHAVINGEVYDNDRLREQCIKEFGYKFKGHSDSETVVALYKHCTRTNPVIFRILCPSVAIGYGAPAFLDHMRGEFSLVIYDDRSGEVVAARDRFGIKPLFWTVLDDKLLIAAEVKAFLPLGWKPEWDVESIVRSDCFNGSRTIFKDVQKIEPGKYMIISPDGDIKHHEYWDLVYEDKNKVETRSVEEMVLAVREKLIESIRLRLRADVPVGIYLSGGLDSSAVAGIVKHLAEQEGEKMGNRAATERIACFCIAFDKNSGFDESAIAERTAKFLGVQMYTKDMNEAEMAKNFEDAVWHNEHHNFDLNTVGKYCLSELPRQNGFKVILSGEGADEIFAGYPWFPCDFLSEPDSSMPNLVLQRDPELRQQLYERTRGGFLKRLSLLTGGGNDELRVDPALDKKLNKVLSPALLSMGLKGKEMYYKPSLQEKYTGIERLRAKIDTWSPEAQEKIQNSWHPLHTGLYTWCKSQLPNVLLTSLGDRCEMAHSIEGRPPFLDHELAELVGRMPPSVKMHYGPDAAGPQSGETTSRWFGKGEDAGTGKFWEKWILREATKPFVTEELYTRRKHPYTAPLVWPKGGPMHQLFSRLLTKENIEAVGFLDWPFIADALAKGFGENADIPSFRHCQLVGSLVTISQRFGVAQAQVV
ncbi:asparagine synthase [Xylariaceae sp. AK1471]|nr:asparagine synthase [Xylariaceae sp. AK1471]